MDKDKLMQIANSTFNDVLHNGKQMTSDHIEKFTQIIRDDRRAELLAGSGEPVAYGNQEYLDDKNCTGMTVTKSARSGFAALYTADQLAAAVLRATEQATARANASWQLMCEKMAQAERERLANYFDSIPGCEMFGGAIAEIIRARGEK